MEQNNSALVKALIDLDNYKVPQIVPVNNLEYLQLERGSSLNSQSNTINCFKKAQDKTERIGK